jgi:hypothetical protein
LEHWSSYATDRKDVALIPGEINQFLPTEGLSPANQAVFKKGLRK